MTTAFDRIAEQYDALWTDTAIGRAQRDLVWRWVDPLFHAGDRILDVGCGTGEDAEHFAARGCIVHATDASAAMVEIAQRRSGFLASVLLAEEAAGLAKTYDGAISNFGVLNCLDDLPSAARGLARVVRPGGYVAVCIIGRFCAWETLYYVARLRFAKSLRRLRRSVAWSGSLTVHYPSVVEIRTAFEPAFELKKWIGVGLLAPPSYVRLPVPLVRFCGVLDRLLAPLPLLRALCDHRLLIFRRK